jgi:TonB family protein
MALFLLPVVMGLWQVRSLRRTALPWRHGQSVAERLALDAGIHRRVEVLLHGTLPGPMTCGVAHPAVVLSHDAETWEVEDLNRAMVHELEHVRRGDWVSHCMARAVCAVYWFHPLVWIAWRQLALEAERSCDDAVLGRSEATAYADQLVQLARRLSSAAKSPLLAMANRADLATRVGAVLDSRQRRGRAGTLPVALACAAAAVVVLVMSPLRVVAVQQSASADLRVTPMPQFSIDTILVLDAVTASDKNGKTIEGLSANDFAVMEDGVAQTISIFEFQKLAAMSPGTKDSISSYYILGYYAKNQNVNGTFRNIKITGKEETMAKLEYRAGYYAIKSFSAPETATLISMGLDSTFPALIYNKEPEYSEEARKAKYQGTVALYVEVNTSGEVTNVKVSHSLGLGLDEKAIEAVRQWKFKPGMKNGKPVTVQAEVKVSFRLV